MEIDIDSPLAYARCFSPLLDLDNPANAGKFAVEQICEYMHIDSEFIYCNSNQGLDNAVALIVIQTAIVSSDGTIS